MLTLDPRKLGDTSISVGTGWLLSVCMEARGKQDRWIRQKPELLEVLRTSDHPECESSNRIEGVTVAASRLRPLVIGMATFVLDLLCIHPFRDGNGRVSRLATSLLLQSHGFQVAGYISLERLIEESKGEYYGVLKLCSQDWHAGNNEVIPWWNFFLGMLRGAYQEFERQVESVKARPAKSDLARQTVLAQVERFTLADMAAQLPGASPQLIKKVLAELKKAGRVRLAGRGRGARWEIVQ